ncbi:hypothetical protein LTR51_007623 [Lithohypha guttulata]|nr:hypothetical protein LTR51_007623 [Lithohypha guttulata]
MGSYRGTRSRSYLFFTRSALFHIPDSLPATPRVAIHDTRNRTLGFQKVFAIGFENRVDKRDAITIGSSLSEFDVDWSGGVRFADIPKKAIAETWDFNELPNSTHAAWRAHLNLLRHIVNERIQTALIMEDDTDWDWFLKDQLDAFAESAGALQETGLRPRSPYGDSWHALWLGHCRLGPNSAPQDVHFLSNDITVPPVGFRHSIWRQGRIPPELFSNDTRAVFRAHGGMCTYAYAITYEGAQKIITSLSLMADAAPFDVAMSAMCRQAHLAPFNCYGIHPPIFASHRFAGSKSRDSDLMSYEVAAKHPEFTWDIVYSVLQNAPRLLSGATTVASQWPNDTRYAEIDKDETLQLRRDIRNIKWQDIPMTKIKGVNSFD